MFDLGLLRRLTRGRRSDTIGPREAELLLDRTAVDGPHAHVAAVLDAAAAGAQPDELFDERAAVDAFVSAYRAAPNPAPSATRRRTGRTALVALTAVSASLVAGTAFAARTGQLPGALQRGAHSLFSGVGVPAPATTPPATHPQPAAPPTGPRPSATDTAAAQQLLALCRTWIAVRSDPRAGPITAAQRHDLAAAAGGEPAITGFCEHLLEPTPAPTTHATPTKPGNPSPGRKPSHPVKPTHP